MRRPAFSMTALIAPVRLRAVASGLMMENVRSIAMRRLPGSRCCRKRSGAGYSCAAQRLQDRLHGLRAVGRAQSDRTAIRAVEKFREELPAEGHDIHDVARAVRCRSAVCEQVTIAVTAYGDP